jgi:hypothetical protein
VGDEQETEESILATECQRAALMANQRANGVWQRLVGDKVAQTTGCADV